MPAAVRATLQAAALNAYDDIIANYDNSANQIKDNLGNFLDACPYLNDDNPQERTVRNWVPMLRDIWDQCPSNFIVAYGNGFAIRTDYLANMAETLSNFLWAAHYAVAASPQRITTAQGAAILAAYNAHIGVV